MRGEFKATSGVSPNTRITRRCHSSVSERCGLGDSASQWRGAGGEAEGLKNFFCRIGRVNGCDNFYSAAAAFTLKNVQQKDSLHQLTPRIFALPRGSRRRR